MTMTITLDQRRKVMTDSQPLHFSLLVAILKENREDGCDMVDSVMDVVVYRAERGSSEGKGLPLPLFYFLGGKWFRKQKGIVQPTYFKNHSKFHLFPWYDDESIKRGLDWQFGKW